MVECVGGGIQHRLVVVTERKTVADQLALQLVRRFGLQGAQLAFELFVEAGAVISDESAIGEIEEDLEEDFLVSPDELVLKLGD